MKETSADSATVETVVTEAVTAVPEVTTVKAAVTAATSSAAPVTTFPETTVSETESVTEAVTTTVTEEVTTVSATEVTEAPSYNYGAPVPASPQAKSSSYYDQCAFVGDSHIKGMSGYGLVSDGRVFAQNGMSISHINDYISVDSIARINPSNVYIMMGTNGVMWLKWEDMISQYEAFVKQVTAALPSANIYIFSIPPVSAGREAKADIASGKYLNSDIDGYNKELLKMAEKNKWYYVDVNSAIKNADGCLDESRTSDGIHMSKELYDVFGSYILSHTVD